ncbi:putative glycoside hydrolase, family 5, glycoside hydrolase superfamily [Plasmopara halstedii]
MMRLNNIDAFLTVGTVIIAFCSAAIDFDSNSTRVENPESRHICGDIRDGLVKSRGVNLGGWLVAEHWMTANADFWQGIDNRFVNSGEYTSITKASNPDHIRSKLGSHHATYITEDDIVQISKAGLNTVRVPLGFWILGYDNDDPANQREWQAYTRGSIAFLDLLIKNWAKTHNVAVLLSLHAAKGSQNGADHSSPASPGHTFWSQYSENVANTIEVARFLANRYQNDVAFLGIGLLNEPNGNTDERIVYQYYKDAYQAVRSTGSNCILSIMPMLQKQRPEELMGVMEAPEYTNVWVEWHPYFVWGFEDKSADYLINVAIKREYKERVDKWNARPGHNKLFIGEWSMANACNMRRTNPNMFYTFVMEQLNIHEAAEGGWTLWTWKASAGGNNDVDDWSLQKILTDSRLSEILQSNF